MQKLPETQRICNPQRGQPPRGGGMVKDDSSPVPTIQSNAPAPDELARCVIYSRRFRESLEDYDLLPTELRLLLHLCLETYDQGLIRGRVDLPGWAAKLRMREAKGLRVDKCERVFKSVCDLGIVDLNAAQATFELRPDPSSWSNVRAFYGVSKQETELTLCAERQLSESLSELSREKALLGAPGPTERDWRTLFTEMKAAVQAGPEAVEQFQRDHPGVFGQAESGEKSADVSAKSSDVFRGKNPPTQNNQQPQVFAVDLSRSGEKSADPKLIASCTAFDVQKAKPAKAVSGEKSAESGKYAGKFSKEEAWEWLFSVDAMGQLNDALYGPQWAALCERYPNYVMTRLKPKLEAMREKSTITDPIAYLSKKAREEGRMIR